MNLTVAVTKEVTFDCAHMLSGHAGKCANLHGHTYKVQITVKAPVKEAYGESDSAMVMDFAELKSLIQEVIVNEFDHAVIFSSPELQNDAEKELYAWAQKWNMRHFVMDDRTTSECMATYFASEIKAKLGRMGHMVAHVSARVWETPTSFAEV